MAFPLSVKISISAPSGCIFLLGVMFFRPSTTFSLFFGDTPTVAKRYGRQSPGCNVIIQV